MAPRASINKSVHSVEQLAFQQLMTAARKKAGLTQQELADRLGKPQSFVAKYEGGERRVDLIEFIAISRAIGAKPEVLLKALIRNA